MHRRNCSSSLTVSQQIRTLAFANVEIRSFKTDSEAKAERSRKGGSHAKHAYATMARKSSEDGKSRGILKLGQSLFINVY